MPLRVDLEKLSGDIAHSQREIGTIPLPNNETASVDRPLLWNRAIGRLRDASLQVLANQSLLVCYLQESADGAGDQAADVKPADSSGGNGGEPAKDQGKFD